MIDEPRIKFSAEARVSQYVWVRFEELDVGSMAHCLTKQEALDFAAVLTTAALELTTAALELPDEAP